MFRLAACLVIVFAWSLPAAALDHFECYQTVRNAGTQKVALPPALVLADAFETVTASPTGVAANFLCNPVDKNGEGIEDPTTHLACYKMRYVRQPPFQRHAVTTANQFELQTMTAVRRGRLCVPSNVDGVPAAHAIDHFKCYALRSKRLATPVPVTLVDPLFGPATALATRAIEWCQAVSKNGEPVPVPGAHLTCYKLTDLAPHFSPMGAFLDNQFGMGQAVRARSVAELCVPDGTAVTTTTTTSTTTTTFSFACCSNGFGVCDYALTPELCGPISAGAPGSLCDAVTGTCIATASPGDCCNDLTLTLQGSQCFAGANANFQGQCGDFHPNSLCPTNGGPCSP